MGIKTAHEHEIVPIALPPPPNNLAALPTLEMSAPCLAALSHNSENYSAGSKGGEHGAFVTIEKDFWELDEFDIAPPNIAPT